ncbi:MAG: ribosome recycling factor [Clostridia bacterium]|nr:ribosome recycling factor [Clostridia bacterium]
MKINSKDYEVKMQKTVQAMENEFSTIRAGRANPAVLDKITVEYYGAPSQINAIAEVKVPEARVILIQPWEASTLKLIEKAIIASDLGITPQNDGKVLRLTFPQLTEERRKEITKQIAKMGEDAKVAVRNIRRDANDKMKDMKKKSEITEDEQKICEKEIQDITDKYVKIIDDACAKKNKEIMEI